MSHEMSPSRMAPATGTANSEHGNSVKNKFNYKKSPLLTSREARDPTRRRDRVPLTQARRTLFRNAFRSLSTGEREVGGGGGGSSSSKVPPPRALGISSSFPLLLLRRSAVVFRLLTTLFLAVFEENIVKPRGV